MNVLKRKAIFPNRFGGYPLPKKSRLLSPDKIIQQKIINFDKMPTKGYPHTTSSSLDNAAFDKMFNSNFSEIVNNPKNEIILEKTNIINNKIIIDLQQEYDEDQEFLDLLEQKVPIKNHTQNKGIKALIELKKSKIEIIPEEDEDKKPIESKDTLLKEKEYHRFNIHSSQNLNRLPIQQLGQNQNIVRQKQILLPRQIHLQSQSQIHNQDLIQGAIEFRASNINYKKQQLNIFNKKNNSSNEVNAQNIFTSTSERKEINKFISPNLHNYSIVNDEVIGSSSPSKFLVDSMRKQIIINNSNNNSTEEINKDLSLGFKTKKLHSIRQINIINNNEKEKFHNRPLSNPHCSNSIIKEAEYLFGKHNKAEITNNHIFNKRDFSINQLQDKKRLLIGSAPSQSIYVNERVFYKNNSFNNNKNFSIRPHKIKIEKGLVSSQFIEQFSSKITTEVHNAQVYNISNSKFTKKNDPIKVIQL